MLDRRTFLQTSLAALLALAAGTPLLAAPGDRRYTVQRGDTLSGIASRHGVSVADLRSRNRLRGDLIRPGQQLVIPAAGAPTPEGGDRLHPRLRPVVAATAGLSITRGRWEHIVLHHSGIEAGNARAYDGAHRRRGMEHGLAYHFVIGNGGDSGLGEIEIGPRWLKQLHGGHVRDDATNQSGIGICLVGNFERRRPASAQFAACTALVDWLRGDLLASAPPRVTVHRWVDRAHTVCPGRLFPYDTLRRRYGSRPA